MLSQAQNDLGIICNIYNLLLWLNHPNIPYICLCLGLFVYEHTYVSTCLSVLWISFWIDFGEQAELDILTLGSNS